MLSKKGTLCMYIDFHFQNVKCLRGNHVPAPAVDKKTSQLIGMLCHSFLVLFQCVPASSASEKCQLCQKLHGTAAIWCLRTGPNKLLTFVSLAGIERNHYPGGCFNPLKKKKKNINQLGNLPQIGVKIKILKNQKPYF